MNENTKVFVSYSWDSDSHRDWVNELVKTLRGTYGVNAIFDGNLPRANLNRMMVEQIQNAGKIIIVLTKNYAKRAEEFSGGVGTETQLLLSYIMKKPEKLVFIKRENTSIPLCFDGFEYVDFTCGISDTNMKQLMLKIMELPEYEVVPITQTPKKIVSKSTNVDEDIIPVLTKPTVDDENEYLLTQLELADKKIVSLLEQTKEVNKGFCYTRNFKNDAERTGMSFELNGSFVEKYTHYTVYSYTASFGEDTTHFRIWHSKESSIPGIYGTSNNMVYGSQHYNGYELHVALERSGRTLSLKNGFGSINEEIRTGKDLGVCVFKRMMSRIRKQ